MNIGQNTEPNIRSFIGGEVILPYLFTTETDISVVSYQSYSIDKS